MIKTFGCEKNYSKFSEASNISSHVAAGFVSGMSPHSSICMAKRHRPCVGGIFMDVLVFQEHVFAAASGRPGMAHVKSQGFVNVKTFHLAGSSGRLSCWRAGGVTFLIFPAKCTYKHD